MIIVRDRTLASVFRRSVPSSRIVVTAKSGWDMKGR